MITAAPNDPPPEPLWKSGRDLLWRDDIYCWPPPAVVCDPSQRDYFLRVTSACAFADGGMKDAMFWWIAQYVDELTQLATSKSTTEFFHPGEKQWVQVKAIDILANRLPRDFGTNAGKHWIKSSGYREMRRRGDEGTIIHDAFEDWNLKGLRVKPSDVEDYTQGLINSHEEMRIPAKGETAKKVRQVHLFCERHVAEVEMAEAPVFHFENRYAGTLDFRGKLKNLDGVDPRHLYQLDAKRSKGEQLSHLLQHSGYFYATHMAVKNTTLLHELRRPDRVANVYFQPDKYIFKAWPHECLEEAYDQLLRLLCVAYYVKRQELLPAELSARLTPPKIAKPVSAEIARLSLAFTGGKP